MNNNKYKVKFTGERMVNNKESDLYRSHENRYLFAVDFCKNKRVLDIACGSGYGSYLISNIADSVVGIDIDKNTIQFCSDKYKNNNLEFRDSDALFLNDDLIGKLDVVVSFETIEHILNYDLFLLNIYNYLDKGGVLILSTPNNFKNIYPPENKFHSQEFNVQDLISALNRNGFNDIKVYGQNFTDIKNNNNLVSQKESETFLVRIIKNIYKILDKIGVISKIDNFSIYKIIGNLQRKYKRNFEIKYLDIDSEFYQPETLVVVCKKEGIK